jgi:hypothetical protein
MPEYYRLPPFFCSVYPAACHKYDNFRFVSEPDLMGYDFRRGKNPMRQPPNRERVRAIFCALLVIAYALIPSLRAAPLKGSAAVARRAAQRDGRLAPPLTLRCSRDNTTSFTGRVLAYRRSAARVTIRVRTDDETTEEFTLRVPQRGGASRLFLINGQQFNTSDWKRVEASAGRLRPRMRATVWACYEGDKPRAELIDWRPAE